MKITEIITPESVLSELKSRTKPEVLKELADHLCRQYSEIPVNQAVAVLSERERLGSTAIGDGIAIPHGKLKGVKKIVGVFGRSSQGVDFDSLDGGPTQLFFLLMAPEDSTSLHLKALARVSRLFKDGSFRDRLVAANDRDELFRLIRDEDAKY